MTEHLHPARRLDESVFDIEEVAVDAALSAYEEMRARGFSAEMAWDLADSMVAGIVARLEAADAS